MSPLDPGQLYVLADTPPPYQTGSIIVDSLLRRKTWLWHGRPCTATFGLCWSLLFQLWQRSGSAKPAQNLIVLPHAQGTMSETLGTVIFNLTKQVSTGLDLLPSLSWSHTMQAHIRAVLLYNEL